MATGRFENTLCGLHISATQCCFTVTLPSAQDVLTECTTELYISSNNDGNFISIALIRYFKVFYGNIVLTLTAKLTELELHLYIVCRMEAQKGFSDLHTVRQLLSGWN